MAFKPVKHSKEAKKLFKDREKEVKKTQKDQEKTAKKLRGKRNPLFDIPGSTNDLN